jgi:hypothetical protein
MQLLALTALLSASVPTPQPTSSLPPQNISPSAQLTGTLLDQYSAQGDGDDADEDELIGVSVNDTSYIPRSLLKRIGYKLVQAEETGEWEAVQREGADQVCVACIGWGGHDFMTQGHELAAASLCLCPDLACSLTRSTRMPAATTNPHTNPPNHTPQIEISPELAAELQSIAAGTAVDPRMVNSIVADLMSADEDLEEDEVPLRARRNPVVAAAAVSGAH